jgi:phage-related protein
VGILISLYIENKEEIVFLFWTIVLKNIDILVDYDTWVCIFIRRLHKRFIVRTHLIMKKQQSSQATNN